MSAVICPWSGTYGFRSRLIEVMALGVPVVASPDAVFGMELEEGSGLFLGANGNELAGHVLRLLENPAFAGEQSRLAREQVNRLFSYDNTYIALMDELSLWLRKRKNHLQ
jgi:glycosyltransferase involved in cell wall biosynthesis